MSLFAELSPYLKQHRTRLLVGLGGMSLFTGLTLAQPLLMRYLFNDVVEAGQWQMLGRVVLLIAAAPLLAAFFQFINRRIIMRAGYGLEIGRAHV